MNDLQKEIKKLSNLKNLKKLDKSALERVAQINVWKRQAKIEEKFAETEQKVLAKQFLDNYLDNYEFSDYNDISNVCDLIYEEVLKQRIQAEIDKIVNDANTKFVPDKVIESLHKIESRIWELKEKAGIVGKKEQEDLSALQEYDKKFKIYIAHNRNEFTFWAPEKCKDCGSINVQPVLIRRRCNKEKFEILKHPFFSGRFWYNRRGIELIKADIWTKEQYAWVFQTSVKYVNWCLENEHKIVEIDEVEEKEIQTFINETSYLKKDKILDKILKEKRKQ